jgi:WD40 repeat protein
MKKYIPSEITTPFKGNCLEITRCGRFFVFGSVEGRIGVVDIGSKEVLQDIPLSGGSIYSIAMYNYDTNFLAAGKDGIIRNFDFRSFQVVSTFEGHEKEVNKIVVSVDESLCFSASDDTTVRAWNLYDTSETKVLYYHEKAALCLDKSADGSYLVSGGADKKIKIFNLQTEVVEQTLNEFTSSVWSVKISNTNSFVAGGDSNGNIKLWEMESYTLVKTLSGHEKRVTHIEFNKEQTVLISSSNDHTLRIWDLVEDKNELILTGHTGWVKSFKLSPDQKFIYSIAENYKILSWVSPRFNKSCRRSCHQNSIQFMCYSRNNHLIFTSDLTETKVWDVQTKSLLKSMKNIDRVTAMNVDSDGLTLLVAFSNYDVYSWNVEQESFIPKYKHSAIITSLVPSPDGQFLAVADINFRVMVLYKRNFAIANVFRSHNNVINVVVFSKPVMSENDQLFSGGEESWIFMYSIRENKSRKLPTSHTSPISALNVSRSNDFLISGDREGVFKIWSIAQTICIKTLRSHTDRITGIYFSENMKYFLISSCDSSISLWNSVSFAKVTHLKSKYPVTSFICTKNESELVSAEGTELQFMDNPLRTTQFFIYGPGREYYSFMKYIINICDGNDQEHDPSMDNWMVVPYEINALHFYSYFNLPGHLKLALQNKGPFYVSKSDYNPLSIALHRNFRDCINAIIKQIRLNVNEDPYSVSFIENSIVKLNELGFRGLDEFYSCILYKSDDKLLPKFCDEHVNLPVVYNSRNLAPQQKDFFSPDMISGFGRPLAFWQSALKIDAVMGSKDSIIFLESLLNCPNPNIFKTDFIRQLILYKWGYLKWVLMPQAAVYVLYLLFLIFYLLLTDLNDNYSLSGMFFLNISLACYEIFQLTLTGVKYFKDPWNYIDFFRMTSCFVYIIFAWVGFQQFISRQVLVLVIFLSCIRGISYFRLFDNTRYMINLLREVIKDMRSFLILFFYSTYSFALIYFIMVNNLLKYSPEAEASRQDFSHYIATSYLLSLGEFDTNNYGTFEWIIFFFASVINPLIMLNLIISIIGDTFGRVKEEQEIADMQELTSMVVEGEYVLFCKRNQGKKSYMQICKEAELTSVEASVDRELDNLKLRIRMIEEVVLKKSNEMKTEINETVFGVNQKVDELTSLIEQISLTQD